MSNQLVLHPTMSLPPSSSLFSSHVHYFTLLIQIYLYTFIHSFIHSFIHAYIHRRKALTYHGDNLLQLVLTGVVGAEGLVDT